MAADTENRAGADIIAVGDLVLDRARYQVRRGEQKINLPRLSYRLFDALVNAAPGVLGHDELVEQVWAGRLATPETVTQRVKLLRDALGDDARNPRYVALVRGQGYRIAAQVRRQQDTDTVGPERTAAPRRTRQVVLVSAVVALLVATAFYAIVLRVSDIGNEAQPLTEAPANAVAVLPFSGMDGEPDTDYLRAGLGDALRDQLRRMGGLQVAARSSSERFRLDPPDAITIASRLRVRNLIEGYLRHAGDRLTIGIGIVDGRSGYQWWSNNYETDADGLPAMQARIAHEIMAQLLPDNEISLGNAEPGSLNPTANRLMQRARYYYHAVREQPIVDTRMLDRSIDLYRMAIEADPRSALAHIRLAQALLYRGDVDAARAPIAEARAIDPNLSEVQYTLGLFRWMTYEPGSGVAYQRAIELDPSNPDAQEAYGKWIWHQLESDRPEQHFLRALELDSFSLTRYADLGTYYGMSGQAKKANVIAEQIGLLFSDAPAYMAAARTYELVGDVDRAIAWALRAHDLEPDRQDTGWMVAELYARIGDFAQAHDYDPGPSFNLLFWERRYAELIDLGQELVLEQPEQEQIWYGMAFALTATGDYDTAIRYLNTQGIPERAFSENRRANQEEAMVTLADALKQRGDVAKAKELAAWFRPFLEKMIATGGDSAWWPHLYLACVESILDHDDAVLDELERMDNAVGLPWYPLLVDAPCLTRFAGNRRYDAVVRSVDKRQSRLRNKLPATIAELRAAWETNPQRVVGD